MVENANKSGSARLISRCKAGGASIRWPVLLRRWMR